MFTFRIGYLKDISGGRKLHIKNDEKVLLHVPGHYDVSAEPASNRSIGTFGTSAVALGK